MKVFIVLAGIVLSLTLASSAYAVPSYTDLWDVNTGYINSVTAPGGMDYHGYNPNTGLYGSNPWDAFGATYGDGVSVFTDGYGPGTVHELYWTTNTYLTIKSFNLYSGMEGVNNTNRIFDHFILQAYNGSGWTTLYDKDIPFPYGSGTSGLTLDLLSNVDNVISSNSFRAGFRQVSDYQYAEGPRVIELDGFASALVPEPATMSLLGLGMAGLLRFRRKKA